MSVSSEALNELLNKPSLFQRLKPTDWLWAALVVAGDYLPFINIIMRWIFMSRLFSF